MEIVNEIIMKKLNEIKPYFKNPRVNDKTVEQLMKIIPVVGFNVPIVIDKNGIIVKGHARYKTAFKLGMTEVPCVVTNADEEAIKLDRISDNKVSELSEWLSEGLEHELDTLDIGFDDILEGINLKQKIKDEPIIFESHQLSDEIEGENAFKNLEQQITEEEIKQYNKPQMPQTKKYVECICPHCKEKFYIKIDELKIVDK